MHVLALATDFPSLSFRQPLRRPFGVFFREELCGRGFLLAANKLLRFGKYVRTYVRTYWNFLSCPLESTYVHSGTNIALLY
jgi:hypothetical protein